MNEGGAGGGPKGPAEPGDAATAMVARGGVREAEIRLPSHDLHADLSFFGKMLGFRLDSIFPADDPAVAVISGHGLRLRLERGAGEAPGTIRLLCDDPAESTGARRDLVAPNGTRVEIRATGHVPEIPPPRHALVVQRAGGGSWGLGRAGMRYRDLIPGRLGGHVIASHIRIPDGGPVPDLVHYHVAAFQLVFCYRGWVKVVYEDQGAPFDLLAGDCVIQPPEIRHRVLESSRNAEVIELAVPAGHPTVIDHEIALPTATRNPDRDFGGQRFCRHRRGDARWREWRLPGFEARRKRRRRRHRGVRGRTGGEARRRRRRPGDEPRRGPPLHLRPRRRHDAARGGSGRRGADRRRRLRAAAGDEGRLRGVLGRPGAAGSVAPGDLRDHPAPEPRIAFPGVGRSAPAAHCRREGRVTKR